MLWVVFCWDGEAGDIYLGVNNGGCGGCVLVVVLGGVSVRVLTCLRLWLWRSVDDDCDVLSLIDVV